jgi:hypothetical protein
VLSLLVVPAVFTYMDDLEQFIKRMAGKVRGKAVEADMEVGRAVDVAQ